MKKESLIQEFKRSVDWVEACKILALFLIIDIMCSLLAPEVFLGIQATILFCFVSFFILPLLQIFLIIKNARERINTQNYMKKNKTFGQALEALKQGKRISREGWNGKNMFLFIVKGDTVPTQELYKRGAGFISDSVLDFIYSHREGDKIELTPIIAMYAADGSIVNGWLASQTDMLSNDWCILD